MPSSSSALLRRVANRLGEVTPDWVQSRAARSREHLDDLVGGRARRQVIIVLACVLALDAADKGALSATAGQIQSYFSISKTDFGVLGSITTGVGAVATLPFGIYVDRVTRTRLLTWAIVVWAVAMIASGVATSYTFLLISRVFLGLVTAVAYPAVASLIGDYFPPGERGRIYGYVLSGELVGTGVGIALAGGAASAFGTWRAAMIVLAVPALLVAWLVVRLPEPARGGASRMPAGQKKILSARRVDGGAHADTDAAADGGDDAAQHDLAKEEVREHDIAPHEELVLRKDPLKLRLPEAIRYVLRIRTNVIVIIAGALGYFFFSGLRFFGIQFVQQHYGIGRGEASVLIFVLGGAALAGVLVGGRVADRMLRAGRVNARIVVPAVTFVLAAVLFAPGIATTSLGLAVGLFMLAAFFFAASNPPLDASRLDVMPARLWGRAEAVRSVFRGGLEAAAPVTFGVVADTVFGGRGHGLRNTFLLMLLPLLISGFILLLAMRTYPRDVATADATARALADEEESHPEQEPRDEPAHEQRDDCWPAGTDPTMVRD